VPQPEKEGFQIVVAGFFDQTAFDEHMVDNELPARSQIIEVEAERSHIGCQFGRVLLERQADARLGILRCAVNEKFQPEQRFPATGAPANQGGSAFGESPEGDFIQALDSGRAFRKTGRRGRFRFLRLWDERIWTFQTDSSL